MKRLTVLLLMLAPFMGCNKLNPLNYIPKPPPDDTPALVTGVGTPTGTAVSKNIGPSGGAILSDDGRIELDIPAGALSTSTNITIQPVTNLCPGGLGVSYDLQPNGLKFASPVTFTFHYADSDADGTDPYLFFETVQDSLQQWDVDVYRDVDTIAHTVSFDISHFSVRSMVAGLTLEANPDPNIVIVAPKQDYFASATGNLTLSKHVRDSHILSGDDDLPSLPIYNPVDPSLVSGWDVNGGSANGSIVGHGDSATYTAPSKIATDRSITVSVGYGQGGFITVSTPGRKSKPKQLIKRQIPRFSKKLRLHPKISFHVTITVDFVGHSGVYLDKYHDGVTFRLDVAGAQVTIPTDSIHNLAPTETPSSGTSADGTLATWIPDNVGQINIVKGTGTVSTNLNPEGDPVVSLIFSEPGALSPGWTITTTTGIVTTLPSIPVSGYPGTMSFGLKDQYQVIDPFMGTGSAGQFKWVIDPIH